MEGEFKVSIMGVGLITIELVILFKVESKVISFLEKLGLLDFFKKFLGFDEGIIHHVANSSTKHPLEVNVISFTILMILIEEVSILLDAREVVLRKKISQVVQLIKFLKKEEAFCCL